MQETNEPPEMVKTFFSLITNETSQGLHLFASMPAEEQQKIVTHLPVESNDEYVRFQSPADQPLPSNIPFYLHLLANSSALQETKNLDLLVSYRCFGEHLWVLQSEHAKHIEKCRFVGYFQADDFLTQMRELETKKRLSEKYLYFIAGVPSLTDLILVGNVEEPVPSFADLVHTYVEDFTDAEWEEMIEDGCEDPYGVFHHEFTSRADLTINGKRFPNLKKLTVKDNPRLINLTISATTTEQVIIQNTPYLRSLKVTSPIQTLAIHEPSVRRFSINDKHLLDFKSDRIKGGFSGPIHLTNNQSIVQFFQNLQENTLSLRDLGREYYSWLPEDTSNYERIEQLFGWDGTPDHPFGFRVEMNHYLFSKHLLWQTLCTTINGADIAAHWNEDELWPECVEECGTDADTLDGYGCSAYGCSVSSLLGCNGSEGWCYNSNYQFVYPTEFQHAAPKLAPLAPFVQKLIDQADMIAETDERFLSGFLACFSNEEIDQLLAMLQHPKDKNPTGA